MRLDARCHLCGQDLQIKDSISRIGFILLKIMPCTNPDHYDCKDMCEEIGPLKKEIERLKNEKDPTKCDKQFKANAL